jgi:hypothetical protein
MAQRAWHSKIGWGETQSSLDFSEFNAKTPRHEDAKQGKIISCRPSISDVIQIRMTRPFSLRARPSLIAAIDARAAQLGQDRTKYILSLVEHDLTEKDKTPARRHKFASADLIGSCSTGTGPATNENTRRIIAQRLKERREKNR